MPDSYKQLRNIPFPVLASELGIDLSRFRQRGDGEYIGPCPVHRPKNNTTSFSYSPDGKFHCFSCEIKGRGSIDLAKAVLDIGFKDAVERLKNLPETPAPAIESQPAEKKAGELKPYKGSYEKFAVSCQWLEERIPDAEIRQRYGVFSYNNPARKSAFSGKVMLPIKSLQGILYGYLGRSVPISGETSEDLSASHGGEDQGKADSMPKYLFPKDLPKSEFLFGAHELSTFGPLPLRLVYLVESPFAVMKLAMMGLPAVSPFGWNLSPAQLLLVSQCARGAVFLPDRNKWAEASKQVPLIAHTVWVRMPELPQGVDDPEYCSKDQLLALAR